MLRRRSAVILASVVTVVLSACGGDGRGGQTGSVTPSGTTSETTATAVPPVSGSPSATPTPDLYRTEYNIPPWGELVAMYEYDASQPLDYRATSESTQPWATVYDITYRSGNHRVPAQLVIPDGEGPFPAVIYAPSNDISISWFGADSIEMAEEGYAGLLVSSPEGRPPYTCFYWTCWQPKKALVAMTTYVQDALRGVDLLETLPEIDAKRLGFVGHGIGGDVGAIISGIDDRIGAFVLEGSDAFYGDIAVGMAQAGEGPPLDQIPAYQDGVAPLNSVNYVRHAEGASFLMQDGTWYRDDAGDRLQVLFDALPKPKSWEWQEGDIFFGCDRTQGSCDPSLPAFATHRAWLQEHV